jgi:hypothetical protein
MARFSGKKQIHVLYIILLMKIKPGYIVFENGNMDKEMVTWAAPHTGPALETPTSRDDNSDTVASLCWLKVGGRFVLATVPRKRLLGLDLNRDPPTLSKAVRYYEPFKKDENTEELLEYREKYAWVAKNKADHERRLRIYRGFWDEVKKSGRTVAFIHRKFTRMKNYPSIMDVVIYEDYGFSRKILAPVIRRMNRKYAPFFSSISENYKNAILLEQKRVLERVIEIYGSIELEKVKAEYKQLLIGDLKVIRRYADRNRLKKLDDRFTAGNFLSASRSALKNAGEPRITVESIFRGSHGRSQIADICRRKNVISIESNAFLNYWYPNEASDMVLDIVNDVRPMRKITNYLKESEN